MLKKDMKKLNFARKEVFLTKKISANPANNSYTIGLSEDVINGEPEVPWQTVCFIKDTQEIWAGGQIYNCSRKISSLENDEGYVTKETLQGLIKRIEELEKKLKDNNL